MNHCKNCFLFFLLSLLFSCHTTTTTSTDNIQEYVSGFTSGMIHKNQVIKIRLTNPVTEQLLSEDIPDQYYDIKPNISGKLAWEDARTLVFIPTPSFESGHEYTLNINLQKILQTTTQVNFASTFFVINQALNIEFLGMEMYPNQNREKLQLRGYLSTADEAQVDQIEKVLQASQNNNRLPIRWESNPENTLFHFSVDSIVRSHQRSDVIFSWDGKPIGANQKSSYHYPIPSLNNFELTDLKIHAQPDRYIELIFSDNIHTNQDLTGLVYFSSQNEIVLKRQKNRILVYPRNEFTEEETINLHPALLSQQGYALNQTVKRKVKFSAELPAIAPVKPGSILPNAKNLLYAFKTINLKSVNISIFKIDQDRIPQFLQINQLNDAHELHRLGRIVHESKKILQSQQSIDLRKWNTFSLDLSTLFEVEPGALYRIRLSFNPEDVLFSCTSGMESLASAKKTSYFDGPDETYWQYYNNFDYQLYDWRERNNPCHPSYYMDDERFLAQNLIASDLGIIVKGNETNQYQVIVTNLISSDPESKVDIHFFDYQLNTLAKTKTNKNGQAQIQLNRKPFLVTAQKDNQLGYVRLDDGSALSVSMFDVGGEKIENGLNGFIYGERGIWRPGDSLFLTLMLHDPLQSLPKNQPVIFELYNPHQQLYSKEVIAENIDGFYTFKTRTTPDAPTGQWQVTATIGGKKFSKKLTIETIQPNRLKIEWLSNTEIYQNNSQLQFKAQWLHGAVADRLQTKIDLKLFSGQTQFDAYPDYVFDNPLIDFAVNETVLFEGQTDESGLVTFNSGLDINQKTPGKITAQYTIRVFEKSGNYSTDYHQISYSPYDSYVGVRIPKGEGWNGALYSDDFIHIPVVTINTNGKPLSKKGLIVEVFDLQWRWWWESETGSDLNRFMSNDAEQLVHSGTLNTENGKALYSFKFEEASYGRKLIKITDPQSGHSTAAVFYVTYKDWWQQADQASPAGAEMLTFKTDKSQYLVGEKIELQLPKVETGKYFISIEGGTRVIDQFWLSPDQLHNNYNVLATAEMAPNAYIHISYIQEYNQTKNDLPIRLYGIQSILVENKDSHLTPSLSTPNTIEPESTYTIDVSETTGQAMTYTLAVVDEGLLDLSRFKTPNPWSVFFSKQTLGVKTWDMYKHVIGAYSGEMAGLLALGGDEYIKPREETELSRFKPVVSFLGPFELKKNKTNTHQLTMPNYVGAVRVMVVAGKNGKYGSADTSVQVKKPLMVLGTLPRVLGPNEKIKLPVTIFTMEPTIKKVKVSLKLDGGLTSQESLEQWVNISKQGEIILPFNLHTESTTEPSTVTITAQSGKWTATDEITIPIRPSNPRTHKINQAILEPGKSWSTMVQQSSSLMQPTTQLEVSTIPPLQLSKRIDELLSYPHGCLEQRISQCLVQLHLPQFMELPDSTHSQIQENINQGIQHLLQFQKGNGSMTYWPDQQSHISDWGTSYAGHFMLLAKEKGYFIPPYLLTKWIQYQQLMANQWVPQSNIKGKQEEELLQAYRLYTLARADKPAIGAMNRMKEIPNLSIAAQWRLAAAYALIGQSAIAQEMVAQISTSNDIKSYHRTFGSPERNEALILEVLHLLNRPNAAKPLVLSLSQALNSNRWLSTQTIAYSLISLANYYDQSQTASMKFNLKESSQLSSWDTDEIIFTKEWKENNRPSSLEIENLGSQNLYITLIESGIPVQGQESSIQQDLRLNTTYYTANGDPILLNEIKQGQDIIIKTTITNPGLRGDYRNLALSQIMPSGWEIRNPRINPNFIPKVMDYDYKDIRDNVIFTYFDLSANETKHFETYVNAAFEGKYYLPAVQCEAMYDATISATQQGQWIEIQRELKNIQ